jgi:ribosome-associated heat shock protein Hsp15
MPPADRRGDDADDGRIRFDKWLWAARFYKTRSLCVQAIDLGQARVNGDRAKPARNMRVGELVSIRKRGNATDAARLYCETEASMAAREAAHLLRRANDAAQPRFPGRPTKRERRKLEDFLNEP